MTKIGKNSEVLMHFSIKLEDNSVAENSRDFGKPAKFIMGDGSLTENFEKCLLGLQEGEQAQFLLEPEDAFGFPNPDNIQYMDISKFRDDAPAKVGNIIAFTGANQQEIPGLITQVNGQSVTVDFNHPLAGKRLKFEVEVISVN